MLNKNKSYQGKITINDFFNNAFLRTGFMVMIAGSLGFIGRMIAPKLLTSHGMVLGMLLFHIIVITAINLFIHKAVKNGDVNLLGLLCYSNVSLLGFMTGIFTSIYHQDIIGKALLTTCFVFGITAVYGYVTKKDMSSLKGVVTGLLFTSLLLSIVGFIGIIFRASWVSWIFSIESFISIIFNVVFIVFFMDSNKKLYNRYKNNNHQLQIMNIYASYVFFSRILDLFLNILYLLNKNQKKD